MVDYPESDADRRELRGLVERIKRGDCVLVLGPHVTIQPDDPQRRPLDEVLAEELLTNLGASQNVVGGPPSLRRAADLYYRQQQDREELELTVQDFYARGANLTTDFHRDLAKLPFRLCVCASPDNFWLNALKDAGKNPQKACYNFKKPDETRLSIPTVDRPLVYYLFGHYQDPRSLVLTEVDLIDFLVSIVRGTPPIPDQVRSVLADPTASFLFLGFGFQQWYLRVLLQVMKVYGHRSKAVAFEDTQFFSHPDHEQAIGFFSGERFIDIRPLHWEVFAHRLRETYEMSAPSRDQDAQTASQVLSLDAPRVFISYASADHEIVDALVAKLEMGGIRVWQDKQDLRAGDNWNNVLLDVIAKRVDYVVVVQTPSMTTATRGVFFREIDAALLQQQEMGEYQGHRLRFLIPVKIGDCKNLASLDSFHVIDVSGQDGVNRLIQSILEDREQRNALRAHSTAAV